VRAKALPVDYASHSVQVETLRDEILAALAPVTPGPAAIPMISSMTGQWLDGPEAGSQYWYESLRAPVEFDRAVRGLADAGHQVFVEVSPHPVLTTAISETAADAGATAAVTGTLRRDDGGPARLLASLAAAHVSGTPVDWAVVLPGGSRVDLPTYAFRRQRFWPQPPAVAVPAAVTAGGDGAGSAAEAGFWAAVDGGDVAGLAAALALGERAGLDEVVPVLASWRRRERTESATGGWRYRISWVPAEERSAVMLPGTWLVVVPAGQPGGELAGECAAALTARGAEVIVAETAAGEVDRAVLTDRITPALAGRAGELAGVVSLLGLAEEALPGHPLVTSGLAGTLGLLQALGDAGVPAPLWVLTRGAVAATASEMAASPAQAMVWGLGRVAGLEVPDRWGGLVDLPPAWDERVAERVCAVLAGCGEDQVAIRPAGLLARRLVRAAPPNGAQGRWVTNGTVLVTGGTGAVGGHLARWVAGRGTPRVVLTSRSGPAAAGVPELAAGLASAGTSVAVLACDIAERGQVAGLVAWIGTSGLRLSAVLHAAGAVQGVPLPEMPVAELARVVAAKAAGAAYLDELTAGLDLDGFVLFSSAAATWGSGGQAGYAAANAFLDGLAAARRARGLAGTSVAWGLWGGGGMGGGVAGEVLRRLGLGAMDPGLAVQALGQVLDGDETQLTVAEVDWARFAPAFTLRRPSMLIGDLPEVRQVLAAGEGGLTAGPSTSLTRRLAGLPRDGQLRVLADLIRAEAAAVLGHSGLDAVPPGRAFRDLGFDSLTAVELRDRLTAVTGLALPATLVFDYPTPVATADYLLAKVLDQEADYRPALAELDRLEAVLPSVAGNGEGRSRIAARLEALLRALHDEPAADPADDRELEMATDDEIFDIAEKELKK
jgi:acyl transferase domain-containing protein